MRIIVTTATFLALGASACTMGRARTAPTPVTSTLEYDSDAATFASANGQSEFEYRLHHSAAGRFITADVLEANGDLPLIDVLRIHITGFVAPGDSRPPRGFNDQCGLDVYVNGLRIADVYDNIRPRELVGVEYYEASSAPVQYRKAFSTCPILLLWLKR